MQKILYAIEKRVESDLGQPGNGSTNLGIIGKRLKRESSLMDMSGKMWWQIGPNSCIK